MLWGSSTTTWGFSRKHHPLWTPTWSLLSWMTTVLRVSSGPGCFWGLLEQPLSNHTKLISHKMGSLQIIILSISPHCMLEWFSACFYGENVFIETIKMWDLANGIKERVTKTNKNSPPAAVFYDNCKNLVTQRINCLLNCSDRAQLTDSSGRANYLFFYAEAISHVVNPHAKRPKLHLTGDQNVCCINDNNMLRSRFCPLCAGSIKCLRSHPADLFTFRWMTNAQMHISGVTSVLKPLTSLAKEWERQLAYRGKDELSRSSPRWLVPRTESL